MPVRFAIKKVWIAIAAPAAVAGIAVLLSGGELPAAAPADQPEEVSIPDDRVGSGIR